MNTRITSLLGIDYPVIQGGMIWCSGWRLASAVSNAGGLGLIGAGSMTPELLESHIRKCKEVTQKPFGVNVPLLFSRVNEQFDIIIREGVKVVFTSAGNPATWTPMLKAHGITVVHVVANIKSAVKCEQSGVDAIVAEGFEAGGHNGKEETTTMVLLPLIREAVKLPLIAAGGIASGRSMLAAMALGAEGVQIGTLFATATESSAHPGFKQRIVDTGDGGTMVTFKKVMPVRLIRNAFQQQAQTMEEAGASPEQLSDYLGKGRARAGMFLGDLDEGELEIGQAASFIRQVRPAAGIIQDLIREFNEAKDLLTKIT